jgi:hypothetical protein
LRPAQKRLSFVPLDCSHLFDLACVENKDSFLDSSGFYWVRSMSGQVFGFGDVRLVDWECGATGSVFLVFKE